MRLNLQQAEIISLAINNLSEKLLSIKQLTALKEAKENIKVFIVNEIDERDRVFERAINTLISEGNYQGISEELANVHIKIKEENSQRKRKL